MCEQDRRCRPGQAMPSRTGDALHWRAPGSGLQPTRCIQPSKLCSTALPTPLHAACSTRQPISALLTPSS